MLMQMTLNKPSGSHSPQQHQQWKWEHLVEEQEGFSGYGDDKMKIMGGLWMCLEYIIYMYGIAKEYYTK